MFLRFTKNQGKKVKAYKKACYINGVAAMQLGEQYIAMAERVSLVDGKATYKIYVLKDYELTPQEIADLMKRFIGASNRWDNEPITRRKYEVIEVMSIGAPKLEIKLRIE